MLSPLGTVPPMHISTNTLNAVSVMMDTQSSMENAQIITIVVLTAIFAMVNANATLDTSGF